MATTREEHMRWCKERALEYLKPGPYFSVDEAMASMLSDLGKHDETRNHVAGELMLRMRMAGKLNTPSEMKKFIEGFN